jgi:Putative auto-transporter adhesin, head GIN domain
MRKAFGVGVVVMAAMVAQAAQAAPNIEIRGAIARVTVIPEARSDVAVSVVRANGRLPLRISRNGDQVIVDGGLGWRSINCHTLFGRPGAFAWGIGNVSYDEMPQIVVRTPLQAKVGAGGAVFGSVGPGAGLDLANSGCGDWTVADQNGPLQMRFSGSGDVRTGTVASADVQVSGSSDVHLGTVRNGLVTSISGSGDVTAARVDGLLRARIGGSGDVRIKDGAVTDMNASVAGSGDVRFGGVARTLVANVAGSGDVSAARVTGPVSKHVAGSGDVTVGR